MKRRIFSLALAFVLVIAMLPITAQAAETAVVISGHSAGSLEAEIDDYMSAHSISDYADIESLTVIGGTLNHLDRAFLYSGGLYSTLTTVDFSETNIDYTGDSGPGYSRAANPNELPQYAFGNWNAMTSLALPDSVTVIKEFAINNCPALETLYLPADIAAMEAAVFGRYNYSLKDVYTISTTPPAYLHPNAFMEIAEGAAIHVPDGSQSNWDAADFMPNNKKCTDYLLIEDMAPVVTYHAERTSETTAEITLLCDEPGYCFYEIVEDGAAEPAIDTSGAGEAFADYSYALELNLTGLEPVAYDIYVKARDLRGHISELLKIDLEWYLDPQDIAIHDHEAGKLGEEVAAYLNSLGIPGKFEKIKSLKVSGGALSDDDWNFFYNTYQIIYCTQSIDLSGTTSRAIPEETFEYYQMSEFYLPEGIERIGEQAFKDCNNLSDITILGSTPPTVGVDAFVGIPSDAAVHVPIGSAAAYKAVDDGDTTDDLWYGLMVVAEDMTLPVVTGVTPSGTGVSRSGNIVITFSEPMDTSVAGAVYLSADGGSTYSFTLRGKSWTVSDAVYTASYSGLAYSKEYTIVIAGFRDRGGNTMLTDSRHSFTTKSKSSSGGGKDSSGEGKSSSGGGSSGTVNDAAGTTSETAETGNTGANTVNPFTDVNRNAWFYNGVMYVYGRGLMTGAASNSFNPAGSMTRGMLVTVLYRLEGKPGGYTNTYSDVTPGAWYEQAAAWAAANGIANGVGNNCFAPENTLTREQLAMMLYNYAKYKGLNITISNGNVLDGYTDIGNISAWAKEAVKWAVSAGIISGDGSSLDPQAFATRAEVAVMLQRFIENLMG